mmetsp:Transcript_7616/g.13326  ORF Transcript_7616/g.13326 Transcript_7616/m.13326 type:complete len:356 (-) Transcript_7616:45-1112(-)
MPRKRSKHRKKNRATDSATSASSSTPSSSPSTSSSKYVTNKGASNGAVSGANGAEETTVRGGFPTNMPSFADVVSGTLTNSNANAPLGSSSQEIVRQQRRQQSRGQDVSPAQARKSRKGKKRSKQPQKQQQQQQQQLHPAEQSRAERWRSKSGSIRRERRAVVHERVDAAKAVLGNASVAAGEARSCASSILDTPSALFSCFSYPAVRLSASLVLSVVEATKLWLRRKYWRRVTPERCRGSSTPSKHSLAISLSRQEARPPLPVERVGTEARTKARITTKRVAPGPIQTQKCLCLHLSETHPPVCRTPRMEQTRPPATLNLATEAADAGVGAGKTNSKRASKSKHQSSAKRHRKR